MTSGATSVPLMKPIRFVTNENGTPYQKRRRISAACTTCRRRKTRCSGERPNCQTCALSSQRCGGYGLDDESTASTGVSSRRKSVVETGRERKDNLASPQQAVTRDSQTRPNIPIRSDSMDGSRHTVMTRNRMPYFRYFGPTAIMPGWRQMVVKIGQSNQAGSHSSTSSPNMTSASAPDATLPVPSEIPAYDTRDGPVSPLILSLCRTFFMHLSCTFPFLQTERFLRDVRERQVEACLVDAVCALACRFHSKPLAKSSSHSNSSYVNIASTTGPLPQDFGPAFAQRAKYAITDAFGCPSVAVVQAALLIAYDEFGASRDSGLWMYLGIALRMSEDLGMEKTQGLRYEGLSGPTPREFMAIADTSNASTTDTLQQSHTKVDPAILDVDSTAIAERKAIERERIDTFWAVFFLDRVISSGTGRPVKLRAKDIEIAFPPLCCDKSQGDEWPDPFASLVRVIHLYGYVTDVINGIKKLSDVTRAVIDRLTMLESHLTTLYQNLSSKLHFNVVNFQHYVSAGQGTNFILLHFWFHMLIVLLHQPTLLQNFEGVGEEWGRSRELSMSSAKTIADILAFAEVIDPGSALGNPFTSQPTYVAACAFLKEMASHTAREHSTPQSPSSFAAGQGKEHSDSFGRPEDSVSIDGTVSPGTGIVTEQPARSASAKHSLLAVTAKENYQKCYGALQSLERYWSGTKYILTVLDQKAKGVADALLYTQEEMECALELPTKELSFTRPGWRRKLSGIWPKEGREAVRARDGEKKREAIGWSLTGTMNSPSTSLAVLFPSQSENGHMSSHLHKTYGDVTSVPHASSASQAHFLRDAFPRINLDAFELSPSGSDHSKQPSYATPSTATSSALADAEILLSLHSPFPTPVPTPAASHNKLPSVSSNFPQHQGAASHQQSTLSAQQQQQQQQQQAAVLAAFDASSAVMTPFSDGITIQSQDIDVSALGGWGFGPPDLGMGIGGVSAWAESYLPADMFGIGG